MRLRDELVIHNERVKLTATAFNAAGLGLIGFALLRPLTEDPLALGASALWWTVVGLAFHALARYVLGRLRKEPSE